MICSLLCGARPQPISFRITAKFISLVSKYESSVRKAVASDQTRMGYAVVRLGATPAQIRWQSGVDVLSFGVQDAMAQCRF